MDINVQGILNAERLAITRALSFVENSAAEDMVLTDQLYPHLGKAYRVGITGPPGAGKSSLVDRLIQYWRSQDKQVAVIVVDPSSPFTGGAILGDRVRMGRHFADKGVFIRSMATRGSQGGLALRAQDAADVFDAAGFDIILYETVGVGQVELDVAQAADTTVVVLVPESGDDIQAMKAGLMEIADLFVINKADRQGANQSFAQIQSMLEMRHPVEGIWSAQVVKTSAIKDEGTRDLSTALEAHQAFLKTHGVMEQNLAERLALKIKARVESHVLGLFWTRERSHVLELALEQKHEDRHSPGQIAQTILDTSLE